MSIEEASRFFEPLHPIDQEKMTFLAFQRQQAADLAESNVLDHVYDRIRYSDLHGNLGPEVPRLEEIEDNEMVRIGVSLTKRQAENKNPDGSPALIEYADLYVRIRVPTFPNRSGIVYRDRAIKIGQAMGGALLPTRRDDGEGIRKVAAQADGLLYAKELGIFEHLSANLFSIIDPRLAIGKASPKNPPKHRG